jgi:hypothetical protein
VIAKLISIGLSRAAGEGNTARNESIRALEHNQRPPTYSSRTAVLVTVEYSVGKVSEDAHRTKLNCHCTMLPGCVIVSSGCMYDSWMDGLKISRCVLYYTVCGMILNCFGRLNYCICSTLKRTQ